MNYDQLIKKHRHTIESNLSVIEQEYQNIAEKGRKHSELTTVDNSQYDENTNRVDELLKEKNTFLRIVKDIEQFKKHQQELGNSIDLRENEQQQLESALPKLFEEAGSQIFDIYSRIPQQYIHYNALLPRLGELFKEKHHLEGTMDISSPGKTGFRKILRQRMLRGKHKKLDRKTINMFRKIGQDVSETPEFREDEKIDEILSPIYKHNEKIAEIQRIIIKYRKELQKIQAKDREVVGDQNHGQYLRTLRRHISERDNEASRKLRKNGKILFRQFKTAPPEQCGASFTRITAILEENAALEKLIQKIESAQQIHTLKEKQERIYQKEQSIRRQIASLEDQLQQLRETSDDLQKQIGIQKKIRGPEAELG
ncbi:MAG: hypothetical protein ACR2PY_04655 [Salinispira sp.]